MLRTSKKSKTFARMFLFGYTSSKVKGKSIALKIKHGAFAKSNKIEYPYILILYIVFKHESFYNVTDVQGEYRCGHYKI